MQKCGDLVLGSPPPSKKQKLDSTEKRSDKLYDVNKRQCRPTFIQSWTRGYVMKGQQTRCFLTCVLSMT